MAGAGYKLKKGDEVQVVSGKEKGKRGNILQVISGKDRVLVEKVNIVKRHTRQSAQDGGGIIEREAPVHMSNVSYYCQKCEAPVRVIHKQLDNGKKVRSCSKCAEILDK